MKDKGNKMIRGMLVAMLLTIIPLSANAAEIETEKIIELEIESEQETQMGIDAESEEEIPVLELDLGDYSHQMRIGERQLLSVTILPMEATETTITYTSSDTSVAAINGMGRITAHKLGSATITATAGGISQSFELQVIEEQEESVPVTDIEIAEHETEVNVDGTISLSATVLPSEATDSVITYTSSDTAIATVNSSGEVKGISKGNVDITLTAGEVTKTVPLTVKVATTGITMNNQYLVLKPGQTYQLSAKVMPKEANQAVTYKSAEPSVATVSESGYVTAKKTGSTTILVSNGDTSVAVSVIINEAINYHGEDEKQEPVKAEEQELKDSILASEYPVIAPQMLSQLYQTKQVLTIAGDGYAVKIDGKDIVNYNNELSTDISLKKEKDYVSFTLNEGKELCGAVTLYIEIPRGKYLYLYNESKEAYERIEISSRKELRLTTPGEYQLRETKLKQDVNILLYMAIGGGAILLVILVVYVIVKKKYWFW